MVNVQWVMVARSVLGDLGTPCWVCCTEGVPISSTTREVQLERTANISLGLWHMGEAGMALCARAATRQHEQAPCSVGIREVTLLRPPYEQAHECSASQTRWSQFSMDITVFPLSLFPGYEQIHKVRVMFQEKLNMFVTRLEHNTSQAFVVIALWLYITPRNTHLRPC